MGERGERWENRQSLLPPQKARLISKGRDWRGRCVPPNQVVGAQIRPSYRGMYVHYKVCGHSGDYLDSGDCYINRSFSHLLTFSVNTPCSLSQRPVIASPFLAHCKPETCQGTYVPSVHGVLRCTATKVLYARQHTNLTRCFHVEHMNNNAQFSYAHPCVCGNQARKPI
jgi:hypothetical protein